MEKNDRLFDTNPESGNIELNSEAAKSRKIVRILIIIIVLLLIGFIILLVFFLKKDSNSDSNPENNSSNESPFDKIEKESEIHLVPKSGKYDYVLIFMHGLTGNSTENLDKFDKKDGPIPDTFKIILPCAPRAYVTRLNGVTNSWFNILRNDTIESTEEVVVFEDMVANSERIKQIIEQEVKNVGNNYTRIFIGGFSQGAMMSYHIGLSFEHTLGGIIPFCGFPITKTQIYPDNIEKLNIFGILGGNDIYVNFDYAINKTLTVLSGFKKLKIEIFKDEPHQVKDVELDYVKIFIKSLL